jgi:RNase P/RNase MRP subunit p29
MATRGNVVPSNDVRGSSTSNIVNTSSSVSPAAAPLSRNELYTPLIAFQQDKVEPSLYMASRQKIPKSLQESSLTKFLEMVSTHYHRQGAIIQDARNNGSRPLSAKEIEERLRQRAVTLVGNGMFAGNRNHKRKRHSQQQSDHESSNKNIFSNRKRKKHLKLVSSKRNPPHSGSGLDQAQNASRPINETTTNMDLQNSNLLFLTNLNAMWNNYIGQMVKLYQEKHCNVTTLFECVSCVLGEADTEHVGAQVRVTQCSSRPHLVGSEGYVVAVTINTWNIATTTAVKSKSKIAPTANSATVLSTTIDHPVQQQEVAVVPKRGSILTFRLPFSTTTTVSNQLNEASNQLAPKFICVDIQG